MVRKKIYTSIIIFSVILASGFFLDSKGKREFYIPEPSSIVNEAEGLADAIEKMQVHYENEGFVENRVKAFGPREYVRFNAGM